jgi:hypothetical protein
LPEEQLVFVKWLLDRIEEVLADPEASPWMSRWLGILKKESDKGFHPEIPPLGLGDKKRCSIIEKLVEATSTTGAVRHGAESFNYYFPQDLDDKYLVVWQGFHNQSGVPFMHVDRQGLRDFLLEGLRLGYHFPLNPKWVLCDDGWYDIFERMFEFPDAKKALYHTFPEESGIIERIVEIHKKYPKGFTVSNDGERHDLALFQYRLHRHRAFKMAKQKFHAGFSLQNPSSPSSRRRKGAIVTMSAAQLRQQ